MDSVKHPQPVIITRGTYRGSIKDAFLVCEQQLLCEVQPESGILMLFVAYYVFNMQYCTGCTNVFHFLEVLLLGADPPKRARLKYFLHMMETAGVCSP